MISSYLIERDKLSTALNFPNCIVTRFSVIGSDQLKFSVPIRLNFPRSSSSSALESIFTISCSSLFSLRLLKQKQGCFLTPQLSGKTASAQRCKKQYIGPYIIRKNQDTPTWTSQNSDPVVSSKSVIKATNGKVGKKYKNFIHVLTSQNKNGPKMATVPTPVGIYRIAGNAIPINLQSEKKFEMNIEKAHRPIPKKII